MNYIGSKHKLALFLWNNIHQFVGKDLSQMTFCDAFAGTGVVGRLFKNNVKKVISNDQEFYSFVLNRNYIANCKEIPEKEKFLKELNSLDGKEGFIFKNYCAGSGCGRNYFSDENGKKIDATRMQIENWWQAKTISEDLYFFLLCSLLESADKVANTASVYGAFLKKIKTSAQKRIFIQPANFDISENENEVFCEDANELIKKIEGDILYLDPPYNARQYGANYHLLNTIAEYKTFSPKGKTGMPDYKKSRYCSRKTVLDEFENLIKYAKFRWIFLSYNNEGLMTLDEIKNILSRYGKYSLASTSYQRFKADKTENRNHRADSTIEYLHVLEKRL